MNTCFPENYEQSRSTKKLTTTMKTNIEEKTALFIGANAPGHLNSLLGIADKLKEDYNFRTVFLISGKTNFTSIEKHGHELQIIYRKACNNNEGEEMATGNDEKYSTRTEMNDVMDNIAESMKLEPLKGFVNQCEYGFMATVKRSFVADHEQIERHITELNPDLIVLDTWFIPPCVINLKDTPWVYICSANPLHFAKSKQNIPQPPFFIGVTLFNRKERDKLRKENPEKWNEILEGWKRDYKLLCDAAYEVEGYKKLYLDYGLEARESGPYGYSSPNLNLYQYPKEIDYSEEDDDILEYPKRWFRCDNFMRKSMNKVDPKEANHWTKRLNEAMKDKKEMVYFSLGTMVSADIDFMRRIIGMLKEDKKRLYVISKGICGDSLELCADNMIGENYVPQTLILERANLAITHGGNNTFLECFYYGVPMIVLPGYTDQFDNAQRVEDMKFGRRLDINNCTKDQLLDAIEQVISDESIRTNIRKVSKKIQARDDLKKVALMLNKLAHEKRLDEKFFEDCKSKNFDEIKVQY